MAKSNLCWKCACCGDCPHKSGGKSECKYYIKSALTRNEIGQLVSENSRRLRCKAVIYNDTVKNRLSGLNYILMLEQNETKSYCVLKVHFNDRYNQVQNFSNMSL